MLAELRNQAGDFFIIAAMATHISEAGGRYLDTLVEDGERSSEAYLNEIAKSFHGIKVKCTVVRGTPEEAIIEKAETDKNTLIAMATHGRSGVQRWLLGSVAEKVLRAPTNPMLLVRASEEGNSEGEAPLGLGKRNRKSHPPFTGSGPAIRSE